MRLEEVPLAGAFVIEPSAIAIKRGRLARTFRRDQFVARGATNLLPVG
jgi:hypothetical protein